VITQDRKDLYLDHSGDRHLEAKPYQTAEELDQIKDAKAKEIQCFIRQCFAYRRVRRLREDRDSSKQGEVRTREIKLQEHDEQKRKEIVIIFPFTRSLLHHFLHRIRI
jgi:hypothetical protein